MSSSFAYRVALVDDHRIFMQGVQTLLSNRFPNINITGSYTNPLQMLADIPGNTPDIIFMDIEMRELNGIQATEQALQLCPEIKVIALTQCCDGSTASQMFKAGAFGFMTKAQAVEDLETVFKQIGNGEKYIPPDVAMELALLGINGDRVESNNERKKYTPRELKIIDLIVDGKTDKEIGVSLGISHKTVDKDKRNIMRIMGVNKATQIVSIAYKLGLVL
jgi:DNA-binding NarL/FixJ family response regulator